MDAPVNKQVDKSHYVFSRYMHKARWVSVWHQIDEVTRLNPGSVLEIGPGPGVFKATLKSFGVKVTTLDPDPDLNPDYVGSATTLPFEDESFDVVCAFQMLEHLPYPESLRAFREMIRVSKYGVVISLPDAKTLWTYKIYVPRLGHKDFSVVKPHLINSPHIFDGEHYWEINKRGYGLAKVSNDLADIFPISKTYRVPDYPYHRFFIFKK